MDMNANSASVAAQKWMHASREKMRERLILDHLVYVRRILSKLVAGLPGHVDRDGLESAGVVGLVEAANSYDPTRGVPFKTFSFPRIRGAILDELRRNSPLSQKMLQTVAQVRAAWERLEPPVMPEDLARESGLGLDQVESALEAMRFTAPQDWNDLYCTVHSTWRRDAADPSARMELDESRQVLAACILRLPERERLVITMYYADELRLAEIGAVLGISESYTSRLLAAAEFRLKELVRASTE